MLGHLDLHLVSTLETHGHADHITGAGLLRGKLGRTRDAFIEPVSRLQLDYPRHIDRALPANKACGRPRTGVIQG